jgi:hypothetical protein
MVGDLAPPFLVGLTVEHGVVGAGHTAWTAALLDLR